jgi:hypothetical protein
MSYNSFVAGNSLVLICDQLQLSEYMVHDN